MPHTMNPQQRAVLAVVLASYLMIVVDVSIVITGLPRIQRELGFSATQLSWVQNAYILAFGGLLLLGARAGDLFGRRRMFIGGLVVFTAASVAVGLAQSPAWLLGARALQGVGAAVLAPSTLALLSVHFAEGAQRTRAVGYYAAIAGIGASIGLVLGGLLADWISWRAGFFINLPIGAALLWGVHRHVAETERHAGELDAGGALSSTLGMAALVYGLVHAADDGWRDPTTLVSIVAGLVLLAALVWNQTHSANPIMPLRLFADRERAGALLTRALYLGGMVGFWFFCTQLLQRELGLRPALAGLAFLPTTLPNFAAALLAPTLVRRFGNARVLLAGLAVSLVGLAWLAQFGAHPGFWRDLALPMMLIGIGQGATLGPLTTAGIAGVEPRDAGAASGLVNVAHQLGGALGLALLVVVFATAGHGGAIDAPGVLARQIGAALAGVAGLVALALVVALFTASWRSSAPVASAGPVHLPPRRSP